MKSILLKRIMLGVFGLMAFIIFVLGFNTIMSMKVKSVVQDMDRVMVLRTEVSALINQVTSFPMSWINDKEKVDPQVADISKIISDLMNHYQDNMNVLPKLKEMNRLFENFQTQGRAIAEAYSKSETNIGSSYADNQKTTDQLSQTSSDLITIFDQETAKAINRGILASAAALILVILIVTIPTYLFTTATVSQIKDLIQFGNELGEGDLTKEIKISRDDELGLLGRCFNDFTHKLGSVVGKLVDAVALLSRSAQGMGQSATTIKDSAIKQSNQSAQVAKALVELNKTVAEVARNSQRAAESAQQAAQEARSGGEIVDQTVHGMQLISQTMQASTQVVHALGKSSDQIGAIIKVIEDIADQTNLLALNAAIEAARAGEQGRGFAVVADEVRKLAERITQETKEISQMIGKIQSDTKGAVKAMEEGGLEVTKGVELANKAGEALKRIVLVVGQMTDMVSQIAAAAEEHSATTEEISASVELVTSLSQSFVEDAQKTYSSSLELQEMSDTLNNIIKTFKLRGQSGEMEMARS